MCAKAKLLKKEQKGLTSNLIDKDGKKVTNDKSLIPTSISIVTISEKVVSQINSKVVNSKSEHTKPITNSTSTAASMVEPALLYRQRVDELGAEMYEYAVRITEGNMLNAKLALWEAIRRVEKTMREKGV